MKNLDVQTFIEMIKTGTKSLEIEKGYINQLNVFPVPDGDTGSNMYLTSSGAVAELVNSISNISDYETLAESYSKSLLLSARGNSGVIFSQIMSGLVSNLKGEQIELADLKLAFESAKDRAYSAVFNAIEGTILTVIRIISETIKEKQYDTFEELLTDVITIGQEAVNQTMEMLPALKDANVVDSGGYGLLSFLKGMHAYISNSQEEYINNLVKKNQSIQSLDLNIFDEIHDGNGYGYCSEVIIDINQTIDPNQKIKKKQFNKSVLDTELQKFGDSLVSVETNGLVKIHLHTKTPHKLLQTTQKYGEFVKIKIENMTLQAKERSSQEETKKQIENKLDVLFTVPTEKIANYINEKFNLTNFILTEPNSPSVNQFVKKIQEMNCNKVIIITDDTNLIMVAQEAIKFFPNKKVNIKLIRSTNMAETLTCLNAINLDSNIAINEKHMNNKLKESCTGLITKASKDTNTNGVEIKENNFISIVNKKILNCSEDELKVLQDVVAKIVENKKSFDTCLLITGKNANPEVIDSFSDYIFDKYNVFVEAIEGNQAVYTYYIALI